MAGHFFKRNVFRRRISKEEDQEQVGEKSVQCQFCNGYTNIATGYNKEEILSVVGGYLHTRCVELQAKRGNVLDYTLDELKEIERLTHEKYAKIIQERSDKEIENLRGQVAEEERKLQHRMEDHEKKIRKQRDELYKQHDEIIHTIEAQTTKKKGLLEQDAVKERQKHEEILKTSEDAHQTAMQKMKETFSDLERETEKVADVYKRKFEEHDEIVQRRKTEHDQAFQEQQIDQAQKFGEETLDFEAELRREQKEFDKEMEEERIALEQHLDEQYQRELVLTKGDGTVLEMREKAPGIVTRITEQLLGDL